MLQTRPRVVPPRRRRPDEVTDNLPAGFSPVIEDELIASGRLAEPTAHDRVDLRAQLLSKLLGLLITRIAAAAREPLRVVGPEPDVQSREPGEGDGERRTSAARGHPH